MLYTEVVKVYFQSPVSRSHLSDQAASVAKPSTCETRLFVFLIYIADFIRQLNNSQLENRQPINGCLFLCPNTPGLLY